MSRGLSRVFRNHSQIMFIKFPNGASIPKAKESNHPNYPSSLSHPCLPSLLRRSLANYGVLTERGRPISPPPAGFVEEHRPMTILQHFSRANGAMLCISAAYAVMRCPSVRYGALLYVGHFQAQQDFYPLPQLL